MRWAPFAVFAALVLVALLIRGLASESAPPLEMRPTIASYVRIPGPSPSIAWPRDGQAAVAVEGVGRVGTSGTQAPVPIASVAKVMTAYLTLREHPLAPGASGFVIKITPADVAEQEQREALGESTLEVRAGERLSERQALEALLLPSANNVAALLAAHETGRTAAFVARMNATAHSLGMDSTTYTDPSGFEDSTVSTAADQLKLAYVAMREPLFARIVAQPAVSLPVVGRVANYDAIVGRDGYVGIKTGSDRAAGGCLLFAKRVRVGGRRLTVVGAVLGQREGALIEAALTSAERLGDSVAGALRVHTVIPAGASVLSARTSDGRTTTGVSAVPVRAAGWGGLALVVHLLPRGGLTQAAAGEQLATIAVTGVSDAHAPVLAARPVSGPSLWWRLSNAL